MKLDKDTCRRLGMTLFAALAAAICVYFALLRIDAIAGTLDLIRSALTPLTTGIALAYILHPVQVWLEEKLRGKKKRFRRIVKPLSVGMTVLAALVLVTLFMLVVMPQLIDSVKTLIATTPAQLSKLLDTIESYTRANDEIALRFNQLLESAQKSLNDWMENDLLASLLALIGNVLSIANGLVRLFIALIVTVYLMMGWNRYIAQFKKLFLAISKNDALNAAVLETMGQVNRIFTGFITGKLIDSLIIGLLCFVVMTLLGMPYSLLISVIVGVTNIIPMFGPFIGAIPSAFLILLVSPGQCLAFIIFILVLQQVDGNIIGPRILGDSTGLSALYVTIAMLLFSKLFGFFGMIIGVPTFATLYYLVKRLAEAELRRRRLPTDTGEYMKE